MKKKPEPDQDLSSLNWNTPAQPPGASTLSTHSSQTPLVILRLKQVLAKTGLSRSTIYDKLNPKSPRFDETFSRPIKLGASSIGFLEADINAWLQSRIAASRAQLVITHTHP